MYTYNELLRLILSTAISFFASKPPKLVIEESSTCHDRIHWVKDHVFGSRDNNCALAYSKAGAKRGRLQDMFRETVRKDHETLIE